MRVDLFDFELPEASIALRPVHPRDDARMLVVRPGEGLADRHVRDLPELLRPGDALVINDTKVIPAELRGERFRDAHVTAVSVTLYRRIDPARWRAFARPARRLAAGDRIRFGMTADNACLVAGLDATVEEKGEAGDVLLRFDLATPVLDEAIHAIGHMPLPPYIAGRRPEDARDRDDYQTVYAEAEGAVAAPTAGLHFTEGLIERLDAAGVALHRLTLHVGPGTFLPVKGDDTADHRMHAEWGTVGADTAAALNLVRARGGRVVAVGTTSLRLLESAADTDGKIRSFAGETSLFITPGYRFRAVDVLMTNFHLPRSTLFMLVSAFSGRETMLKAYRHAIQAGYRFYSYGDACLLFPAPGERRDSDGRQSYGQPGASVSGIDFSIAATDGRARTGILTTTRGDIRTPAFMPVGTAGTVKAMYPDQVHALGSDIILGNTYHLMLRPGAERVAALGGLHVFANWLWPILTDSGGFQVMSLAALREIDEDGVTFRSHLDGSVHRLTPERSLEIQALLDSDIRMQLDECVALPAERSEVERAMRLSLRWAERSKRAFAGTERRALFGIVQGGDHHDLRDVSAEGLRAIGFDGYAIGGLAVGEPQKVMLAILDTTVPALPAERPRYLMGVGQPDDIVEAARRGVDMFDCVLPTRAGRHGVAYTRFGRLNMKNARHADDPRPLDEAAGWPPARDYSRAYLHHLVKSGESLGGMLLSWNNLAYYQHLMAGLRAAIAAHELDDFVARTKERWARGDLPEL